MSIEAMKQALEALESATPKYTRQRADQKTLGGALDYWKLEQHQRLKAITSLRQAIAEAEKQEPVSVVGMDVIVVNLVREGINKHRARELAEHFIKHTHPQPKREWVGLTDDEITALKRNGERYISSQDFARATEAKLKEKNT